MIPGPIGFGGTVPPAPTPNPMNANSAIAPHCNAVFKSPHTIPTPKLKTKARFVKIPHNIPE